MLPESVEYLERAVSLMPADAVIREHLGDAYFRTGELARLKGLFPAAAVREIPGGGHFPQEDAPEAVTAALLDFLD